MNPIPHISRHSANVNVHPSVESDASYRGANSHHPSTHPMERHHQENMVLAEKFATVAMVLNLFQGSLANPVDHRYIGPGCALPIVRHRLQRLFNRKIINTIVQFDIYRLLDTRVDEKGVSTTLVLDEKKIQRFWDEGIIAPVQRDTPLLLRSRNYSSDPPKLKQMVERQAGQGS